MSNGLLHSQKLANCPWCEFADTEYAVYHHIEHHHSEGVSPFVSDEELAQHTQQHQQSHQDQRRQDYDAYDASGQPSVPREMMYANGSTSLNGGEAARGQRSSSSLSQIQGDDHSAALRRRSSPQIDAQFIGDLDKADGYVECPLRDCEEIISCSDLAQHLDFHAGEGEGDDEGFAHPEAPLPAPVRQSARTDRQTARDHGRVSRSTEPHQNRSKGIASSSSSSPHGSNSSGMTTRRNHGHTIHKWKELFSLGLSTAKRKADRISEVIDPLPASGTSPPRKRLGRAALGRHAHEEQMPEALIQLLRQEGQIVGSGIIPVLEQLLEQSPSTAYAYLCHPCVQHISKLRKEGGFCGYRNIQMLTSYIVGANASGAQNFNGKVPSIFQIQDYIETAWDHGINSQGRLETGGIKGTRKYIGTPEAQAVCVSLDIPCEAQGFKIRGKPGESERLLHKNVEQYYSSGHFDAARKVRSTLLPPIYFQHAGHSMTIIGIEVHTDGAKNLLCFDPTFRDAPSVLRLVGKRHWVVKSPDAALKPYRRDSRYLRKYWEFEILKLVPLPEAVPAN